MESGVDVPEEILWYTVCSIYNSAMRHLRDFSAVYQQKPPKVNPLEISVGGSVGKKSHLERPSVIDEHEPPKNRERVSMASLLDTMMASLGLQSSGPFNSLEELSAAAERVEDLFSTTATEEIAKMVQLILTDRLSSLNVSVSVLQHYPYLQRPFASEFLVEFADKPVKCLLRSCIAPQPASTTANDIPSLVMPFRVTPESFEISRPPSEVFADTMDPFSKVIVNSVMDKVPALHRSIIEAVYAELLQRMRSENQLIETVKAQSELLTGSLAVSIVRAIKSADPKDLYRPASDHAILATWRVLQTRAQSAATSSDLTKEASSNDQKELIERILREFSASSSAAKLEEVLTGMFLELFQRFGEEGSLHKALDPQDSAIDEALMTALRRHLDADASTAGPKTKRHELEAKEHLPSQDAKTQHLQKEIQKGR
ncbi:uncharacterized protein LOC118801132 isoform X2 [Colossoma macropomum]|uniref:uncharacterized protein LOC118801132 isoform X1 n=1 Tax=Colossoma macropomum TaxID=42526 RepID=UPI0018655DCD|nr:uncharacterized protein LOC118801132 isoform X1 [Colossoma macropomum]XP_036417191.1 uncharacterized protein LOC118801132 isoform X2 [Colossoma macropomum]